MKKAAVISLYLISGWHGFAQLGGLKSFEFLNVPNHARLSALGGVNVSLVDRDVNFVFNNPALVSDSLSGWASANYLFYVADVGQSSFAYNHPFEKLGDIALGVRHMSYGKIEGYDPSGIEMGSFQSGETEVLVGKSHQVSYFRLGANLKGVFSNIAGFRSSAILVDVGGVFIHPQQQLTIGMVIKNLGFMLNEYSETSNTELPIDVQIGATFKPEHMPLRFSATVYNLTKMNKAYDDPALANDDLSTLDQVMQHFNVGVEVLVHRNVNVLVGYNGLRQQELKLEGGGGGSGFTFGFSARIKAFECTFSSAKYSVGNLAYLVTVAINTRSILTRKMQ